jgi:hypothetical protein
MKNTGLVTEGTETRVEVTEECICLRDLPRTLCPL